MTPNYPHPLIAREGWPFVAAVLVLAVLVHLVGGFGWAWPFWLLAIFVVQFFRDPARDVPGAPDAILSPADGRVIVVERARDPYADRDALKVSIFMNVFNVHSNRAPVDGLIERIDYFPGKFVNADLDKASESNERNALRIRRDDGAEITCVQVAGLVARRILCYVASGERLARGQRFGFIRFGSRVDLYLPPDAEPIVTIGEKVSATATVVARLPLAMPASDAGEAGGSEVSGQATEAGRDAQGHADSHQGHPDG
ncbi:MAG: phosphatidylserine decarboxylase [Pseudomonadota bacterium]|jgi:phosphatidylserine decarboxylase|nr:phosphatidylserine decarboxylase [Pseudomonadota bacterium]